MTVRAKAEYDVGMRDNTQAAFSSIKRSLRSTTTLIAGLGITAGAGVFLSMTNDVKGLADQVQKLGSRLDETAENLSRTQVLASRSDIGFVEMAENMKKANDRIAEGARGQGKAGDAIARLGLDIQKLSQLAPVEQLIFLAEAFERLPESANKVDIAGDIFGNAGIKMKQALSGGREAILDALAASDRFGTTIGQDMADSIAQANDNLDSLGFAIQGAVTQQVGKAAKAYEGLTGYLAEKIPEAAKKTQAALTGSALVILREGADLFGFDDFANTANIAAQSIKDDFKEAEKSVADFRDEVEKDIETTTFDQLFDVSFQRDQFQRDLNKIKSEADKVSREIENAGKDLSGSALDQITDRLSSIDSVIAGIGQSMKDSFNFDEATKQIGDLQTEIKRIQADAGLAIAAAEMLPENASKALADKAGSQLDKMIKLLSFAEQYIFKDQEEEEVSDRFQGSFRQVNLSRFSLENAGAKPMRTEDPQLKTTNQILRELIGIFIRQKAAQEIAAL